MSKDSSYYGTNSWQKSNVDEQNRGYGIPVVKDVPHRQVANKQEPAGPSSKEGGYL